MTSRPSRRLLVVHNAPGPGDSIRTIEPKPFRRYAFGSLLGYADEVCERLFQRRLVHCSSLALPSGVQSYGKEQLQGIVVAEKYDAVMCHLVLDHGGVMVDDFFAALRDQFLTDDGVLMNPVKSIAKDEVARASLVELETDKAPCVVKKNDNYNLPETVHPMSTQAELDAWRDSTPAEEQNRYVVHKLLKYFGSEQSGMHQLERWIVLFGDLTVNHRCSDEFYIKSATSLSYHVRDERKLAGDLQRLTEGGYNWKGRSIDCAYDNDSDAWNARYAVLSACRDAFHFDYAELDVMRPSKNEFVVIDVNQTPGPSYRNVYWRELAVRLLAEGLGIRPLSSLSLSLGIARPDTPQPRETPPQDLKMLEDEVRQSADNTQATFQLAEAYREGGQLEQAHNTYKKRAAMAHGSAEERFLAQLEVGRIAMRLDAAEAVVLSELLGAYILRSQRAEPLYELARYYRLRKNYAMATLFAKAGVQTARPDDQLRVVNSVYSWQLLDELGTAAYWAGDYTSAKNSWEAVLTRVRGGLLIPPEDQKRIEEGLALATRNPRAPLTASKTFLEH
jgi:hypothetical protein